jgi:hypothetical protein
MKVIIIGGVALQHGFDARTISGGMLSHSMRPVVGTPEPVTARA